MGVVCGVFYQNYIGLHALNSNFYGILNGNSHMHLYTLQCHFEYRLRFMPKIESNRVFSTKLVFVIFFKNK